MRDVMKKRSIHTNYELRVKIMKRYAICLMICAVYLFALSSETAQAGSFSSNMKKAAKLYQEEEYDNTLECYDNALLERPNDPVARYNRAVTLYRK